MNNDHCYFCKDHPAHKDQVQELANLRKAARFSVDEPEYEIAKKWIKEHPCENRGKDPGTIGGGIAWCFTDTSIGQIQTVKCACGAEHWIDTNL